MTEIRTEPIPPTTQWVDAHHWPDGAITQIKHDNPDPLVFDIDDEGRHIAALTADQDAPEGWRTRLLPPGDEGVPNLTRLGIPESEPDPAGLLDSPLANQSRSSNG